MLCREEMAARRPACIAGGSVSVCELAARGRPRSFICAHHTRAWRPVSSVVGSALGCACSKIGRAESARRYGREYDLPGRGSSSLEKRADLDFGIAPCVSADVENPASEGNERKER